MSKGSNKFDVLLDQTKNRMLRVRDNFVKDATSVATAWPDLWHSLSDDCKTALKSNLVISETQIVKKGETVDHLARLREGLQPGGECAQAGLTEGEAAAVLLYTAEGAEDKPSVYSIINTALRGKKLKPHGVLIATLVSALRKLRAHSRPVACVRRWTDYLPAECSDYAACAFLSTTCNMGAKLTTIPGGHSFIILPHRRRAAVVPKCLTFHPNEGEAIFEPGTAFRRIAPSIYEELPHTLVEPTLVATVKSIRDVPDFPAITTLEPACQCLLLYPLGTCFTPLVSEEPSGDPSVIDE